MTGPRATEMAVDVTELFHNPVRTGIQRVVRELLRHWPADGPIPQFVRYEPGMGLLHLSPAVLELLSERDPKAGRMPYEELRNRLITAALATPVELYPGDGLVFIPEVFFDPSRCRFYEERLARTPRSLAMLFYDFLPYLRSELFPFTNILPYMNYARIARLAPHAAFISSKTRQEYMSRMLHRPGADAAEIGPVLPLGADGLTLERQTWSPRRRLFAALGSIDGRKNQHRIVEAFIGLWRAGHDIPLVLIGSAFEGHKLHWIEAARGYKQFRWLDKATDADVAAVLREARATIYASEAEGFGLPPVESLAAGIPVIASADLPSLAMLPPGGQVRLPEMTSDAIAAAVLALQPTAAASRLWRGAAALELGSWVDFAERTAAWCAAINPSSRSRKSGKGSRARR